MTNSIYNFLTSGIKNANFVLKVIIFIVLFSGLISWLIYWREAPRRLNVSYFQAFFWQLMVWSPWLFFFNFIKGVRQKTSKFKTTKRNLLLGGCYALIIWFHWLWFILYSSNFSPYLGFPNENYGVFPYFFIFWSLIDVVLLLVISIYFSGLEKIIESSTKREKNGFAIQVKRGAKKVLLKSTNIYWISAEGYYINIHSDQGKFLLRRTLKSILEVLPDSKFIRIHRSAIINIHYLVELNQTTSKGLLVLMKDGNSQTVSRTYIKNLKEMLRVISI